MMQIFYLFLPSLAFGLCVKKFGKESYACVCNETFCDSFESVDYVSADKLYVFTSGKNEGRLELSVVPMSLNESGLDSDVTISVQTSRPLQEVVGFGGAMTDSAVTNIQSLSTEAQRKILEMYFSPKQMGYTMLRVPFGCTDFSSRVYSYDDLPHDHLMLRFELPKEDVEGKIPLIQQAEKIAGVRLKLVGGAWSAPAWMKNDSKVFSNGFIKRPAYWAWSQYYIKALQAYENNNLKFWALTNGNEPVIAIVSTKWPADAMETFIGLYLGPKLACHFPDLKLLLLDDIPENAMEYIPIMEHPKAASFISGWAIHPYTGPVPLQTTLDLLHTRFPDKIILQTEFSLGIKTDEPVSLGSWSRAEQYAANIIAGLQNWAVSFMDWNLALDITGGPTIFNSIDAGVLVDSVRGEWFKQPILYAMSHFSAFIPPASRIVPVEVSPVGLQVTAAVTPNNTVVIVLLNKEEYYLNVSICAGSMSGVIAVPGRSLITAVYALATP